MVQINFCAHTHHRCQVSSENSECICKKEEAEIIKMSGKKVKIWSRVLIGACCTICTEATRTFSFSLLTFHQSSKNLLLAGIKPHAFRRYIYMSNTVVRGPKCSLLCIVKSISCKKKKGKSKKDLRKRTVDLHKLGRPLEAVSKQLYDH